MDWVHCNACYLQPGDKKGKKFVLTSCGHIFCDECSKTSAAEKCMVCSNSCTTVALEAEMRPDVQQFFDDPGFALKKLLRIIEFQEGHRQRLTSYRRLLSAKYRAAKEEIYKLRKRMEELEREILILKQRFAASSNGGGNTFPRPSPPPAWNLTPRQQITGNAKSASPANSEGWVTPNRLTLKKTMSPSNMMNLSQHSSSQSLSKQKISPSLTSTPQKFSVYPKMNGSANIAGNFRSYRGYSSATPSTPINCNITIKGQNNRGKPVVPSPRMPSYCMAGSTPISSGSLLSNLKLTSPL